MGSRKLLLTLCFLRAVIVVAQQPVTNLTIPCKTDNAALIKWSLPSDKNAYDSILVFARANVNIPTSPSPATTNANAFPPANNNFYAALPIAGSEPKGRLVYKGVDSFFILEGLQDTTTYNIKIIAYKNEVGTIYSPYVSKQIKTAKLLTTLVTQVYANTIRATWMISDTNCYEEIAVFISNQPMTNFIPHGTYIGSSDTIFKTNEQCVYAATMGNGVTIQNLDNDVPYYINAYVRSENTWSSAITTVAKPMPTTILDYGDIAVLALNAKNTACENTTDSATDKIYFVCFQDISTGTSIDITDNGWERTQPNEWGNTEGAYRFTRTDGAITKGTVIQFLLGASLAETKRLMETIGWQVDNLSNNAVATVDINSLGDQLFFMQGGFWNNGYYGYHDATYTGGKVLFGFNSLPTWASNGNTNQSNLLRNLYCFSIAAPTNATNYMAYQFGTAPTTPASQREWIQRINNASNWTTFTSCAAFNVNASIPTSITATTKGYISGLWDGKTTDWFDCNNWDDLTVPIATSNVIIDSGTTIIDNQSPNATMYSPAITLQTLTLKGNSTLILKDNLDTLTIKKSIYIESNTALLQLNSGTINLYGNIELTNGANFLVKQYAKGNTNFLGENMQYVIGSDTSHCYFHNFSISKPNGSVVFQNNMQPIIDDTMYLQKGIIELVTATPFLFTNNAAVVGINENSFIDGNVKKINATPIGFTFPIGKKNIGCAPITFSPFDSATVAYNRFENMVPTIEPSVNVKRISNKEYWTINSSNIVDITVPYSKTKSECIIYPHAQLNLIAQKNNLWNIQMKSAGNFTPNSTNDSGAIQWQQINLNGITAMTLASAAAATNIFSNTICENAIDTLIASQESKKYLWNTSDTSKKIVATTEGQYFVAMTDSNNCPYTDTIFLQKILLPSASEVHYTINANNVLFSLINVQNTKNCLWNFGDNNTEQDSTAFSTTHYFEKTGLYHIQAILNNDCGNVVLNQDVVITDNATNACIVMAPNPVVNTLHISTACNINADHIRIVSVSGQIVYNQQVSGSNWDIATNQFSKGVYFVQLFAKNKIFVTKKIFVASN